MESILIPINNIFIRYVPLVPDSHSDNVLCSENSVIFQVSNFQYIAIAVALSTAAPFRKPLYTNCKLNLITGSNTSLASMLSNCYKESRMNLVLVESLTYCTYFMEFVFLCFPRCFFAVFSTSCSSLYIFHYGT